MRKAGYLHLEDGTILVGELFGSPTHAHGEVVFSTGMTGYPQSMTDPSFAGQILTFTYPLLGNYGVPQLKYLDKQLVSNFESEKIWVQGIIVGSLAEVASHFENSQTLDSWCVAQKIPILSGIDTRALTKKLREHGVMRGFITDSKTPAVFDQKDFEFDYTVVSTDKVWEYMPNKKNGKHVALIDCGVKHGIIRALLNIGYQVTRVPYNVNPLDIHKKYDGVVCSNGPGDPKDWQPTVVNVRKVLEQKIPFIGVCLGHQLLALAIGADTYKMKYGHRGLNQPCQEQFTKRCFLTSQNHGYAVKDDTIPDDYNAWFVNLNDQTNEGIQHKKLPIWSSQFHPEGNPGPFDTQWIFEKFME
ncbi:carbamoyl-phosphate synthase (glutamine-hydrolyzing) small subunit [Candidatus Microgenomates bacterium]|nr:MAG: carbamoyl-phosphate synthase (glutamine-hydrolyzing) small subunit [Candidatus Microgenomates bacterium]